MHYDSSFASGNWKGAQNLIVSLKQLCNANIPLPDTVHSFSNMKLIKTGIFTLMKRFIS